VGVLGESWEMPIFISGKHLPATDTFPGVNAHSGDFKCPVWFGWIEDTPRAWMGAQVSQLHAEDVVPLGLKTQRSIQLFELLRRDVGGAMHHQARKHLSQRIVFPFATRVGHNRQMPLALRGWWRCTTRRTCT
jgi:hypothetical protein